MGELKYFPSLSEGGVYAELLEAHSMPMTQGDATTGVEDLSALPGAGVCSSELPLHWCWGPWSSVGGYTARARVFKWVGKRYAPTASSHGKTHRAAIPPSLEHSIAISAWPPAQSEDRRQREQNKGRERKGCFPLNCHIYLGNTSGRQSQMLHGKVRRIGKKSSCPDPPSTSSSPKAGSSGAMCW